MHSHRVSLKEKLSSPIALGAIIVIAVAVVGTVIFLSSQAPSSVDTSTMDRASVSPMPSSSTSIYAPPSQTPPGYVPPPVVAPSPGYVAPSYGATSPTPTPKVSPSPSPTKAPTDQILKLQGYNCSKIAGSTQHITCHGAWESFACNLGDGYRCLTPDHEVFTCKYSGTSWKCTGKLPNPCAPAVYYAWDCDEVGAYGTPTP